MIRDNDLLKIPNQYEEIEVVLVKNSGDRKGVVCGEKA